MLDYIYIAFIGFSFIVSIVFTKKASHIAYKLLSFFLAVTFCNEVICYLLKKEGISTYVYYNFYYYFRFPFLGFIFQKVFNTQKKLRNFIYGFYVISVIMLLVNLSLYDGFSKLHITYLLLGGVFIIILCLMHFFFLLHERDSNPFQSMFFWVSTAFFFYFLGVLPILGVVNFLVKNQIIFASQQFIITKSLSILLYSLIAIDYIIQWKQTRLKY